MFNILCISFEVFCPKVVPRVSRKHMKQSLRWNMTFLNKEGVTDYLTPSCHANGVRKALASCLTHCLFISCPWLHRPLLLQ